MRLVLPLCLACAGVLATGLVAPSRASLLERFAERPQLQGFTCRHLYLDSRGEVAGACLLHESGFTLDLLPMETAPQAFVWISTPVGDDRGEPHTLEHLLLGKGRRGLSVANAEEYRLSSSSAFTGQLETCYHFSTALPTAEFLVEFEDRLDALLHPDFSDEEIRREVCHVGPKEGPSGLELEEKGTVYTEMLSSWDNPWGRASRRLQAALHGQDHPLAVNQGGIPDAIRLMAPGDIRAFHARSHFLGNMGAQLVLPAGDMTEGLLARLNQSLHRLQPQRPALAPTPRSTLPPSIPLQESLCEVLDVPGAREGEAALVLAAWPPVEGLTRREVLAAQLFLSVAAQGESSNLHRLLIDPAHAVDPLGASSASAWMSDEPGHAVNLALSSVPAARISTQELAALRRRVTDWLAEVVAWPAGHEELEALKARELALITSQRRMGRSLLDRPPGFGERGTGSFWADHLRTLRETGDFRLRLDEEELLAELELALRVSGNPYAALLQRLGLGQRPPHILGTRSQPALMAEKEAQRAQRLEAFTDSLKEAYATPDRQEALRRFAADYEAVSAQLEAQRAGLPMPELPATLPLDQDPEITTETLALSSGTPLCHGIFPGMQGAQFELSVDVGNGAGSPWLALLPSLLTQSGLGGEDPLDFRAVEDALRRETGWASCWLDVDTEAGRAELCLGTMGADAAECVTGLRWLQRFCTEADWSTANGPRLREIARRELANTRERRKGGEESWVEDPAAAWRQRGQHALLHAGSFLTQEHDLFRCVWALENRPADFDALLEALRTVPARQGGSADATRAWLRRMLECPGEDRGAVWAHELGLGERLGGAMLATLALALDDLEAMSAEIPAALFTPLWQTLVQELREAPRLLDELESLRPALLRGSRRSTFTGSHPSLVAVLTEAGRLDSLFGLKSRVGGTSPAALSLPSAPASPVCGLVNPGTTSGVIIATAPLAWQQSFTGQDVVDYLAGNILGGGSDQGLFMQTWAAGLAYSNGIRPRERTGLLRYYAERCPDAAQTLHFVEERVRQAPAVDAVRARTAFITALGGSRGAMDYSERTRLRARELQLVLTHTREGLRTVPWTRGATALDELHAFRQSLAQVVKDPALPARLEERKIPVHALVLPGLASPSWQPVPGSQFFLIGPKRQFELVDAYLSTRAAGMEAARLYPCHWWLMEEQRP